MNRSMEDEISDSIFQIIIDELVIEFINYTQTCPDTLQNSENYTIVFADFNSTDLIYPCMLNSSIDETQSVNLYSKNIIDAASTTSYIIMDTDEFLYSDHTQISTQSMITNSKNIDTSILITDITIFSTSREKSHSNTFLHSISRNISEINLTNSNITRRIKGLGNIIDVPYSTESSNSISTNIISRKYTTPIRIIEETNVSNSYPSRYLTEFTDISTNIIETDFTNPIITTQKQGLHPTSFVWIIFLFVLAVLICSISCIINCCRKNTTQSEKIDSDDSMPYEIT
ncbi:hypothetical protein RF11_07853 [Thelohanellus kitauei]|uniref:Uncharacterized protein n=1 Tax=Thelohanellus kitauei TaxID=669202 RepID=A0A0C2JL12_THEKT|nr:hypothetical protein RF11_07853 [Thelohanellus kitauei]